MRPEGYLYEMFLQLKTKVKVTKLTKVKGLFGKVSYVHKEVVYKLPELVALMPEEKKMTISEQMADFALRLCYEDIPQEHIEYGKMLLLDTFVPHMHMDSECPEGVACGLGNIQKIRDGEPLGGHSNASADFDAVDDSDEDFLN